MALTTLYWARFQAFDANGAIAPNAYMEFFEAGTSTPLQVYADVDGITSLGTTVTAAASGVFAEIFMLPQAYDINLYDENDVLINSVVDYFPPQAAQAANQDFTAVAGVALAAGDGAYISDGSGGLDAGKAYKWDADLSYASLTPETGFVVSTVSLGATVTLRAAGLVSGLVGLTPGALYYISGTAGAISTTPGANVRQVGQAISTTVLAVQTNPPMTGTTIAPLVDPRLKTLCNGRLTLTSGTPVTIADVTAAGTLYWTPYQGNEAAIYSGSAWVTFALAELSIPVPAVGNQVYDVFLNYNAGVPALELTAWTNDTTRATALTTQDGVLVKTGATTHRYVGTVRTVTASQLNDSYALRHVWNYYNRVDRPMRVLEATNSWNYTTAAFRQANGAAGNQLDFVVGVSEDAIEASVLAMFANDTGGVNVHNAIGLDSTSVPATGSLMTVSAPAANAFGFNAPSFRTIPAVGRHTLVWLEYSVATGTTTFTGDGGGTIVQSGIHGMWRA